MSAAPASSRTERSDRPNTVRRARKTGLAPALRGRASLRGPESSPSGKDPASKEVVFRMLAWALKKLLGTSHEREIKKLQPMVVQINKLEDEISKLSDAELKAKTAEFKEKLDNGATL